MGNRGVVISYAIICAFLLVALQAQIEAQSIRASTFVTGLERPVDIVSPRDGSGRLFIVQQTGQIRIVKQRKVLPQPFLDLSSSVSCCGERGLLSMTFHPNYKTNGLFFVNFTNPTGDVVVARFRVSKDPNVARSGSRQTLLTVPHRDFANHNGGKLQFGPDGFLYISIGDGGSGGDPPNNAQNLSRLLGKILRIDVNRGLPYTIPPNNPFINVSGARPEIWAYGLRNPWRISFDRRRGNLYIGDVGQGEFEEINFQPKTSSGGENYGWRRMEGRHCFSPASGCNNGSLTLPIVEYNHSQGCSVTGGYVYRGARIPDLAGTYLYADFCSGVISGAKRVNGIWRSTELLRTGRNISSFGEDGNGEIYFTAIDGVVFKIVPRQ